jgi:cytochrome c biogenesis protein CcmG, thiol:disulfide interchange protein DsbE
MLRYVLLIAAFVGLIVVFSIGLRRDPGQLESTYIDKAAPELDLPTLEDPQQRIRRDVLQGSMSLVNVWATWCVGCRQEHNFLMKLSREKRLPIYGINWRDNRDDALQWLTQFGDPYVMSGYDADGRAGIDWGVYGAPETFLIDSNGVVVYKYLGPLDDSIWEKEFEPRLAAAGDTP